MSFNFNRSYILTIEFDVKIEQPEKQITEGSTQVVASTSDLASKPIETKRVTVTDLHFEADIDFNEKTTGSNGNQCNIKIFNLSKKNRDLITKANNRVILEAGYGSTVRTVFTGQISHGYSIKNNQDIVTILECTDGWTPINSIRYNKSFAVGKNYEDIFTDMISEFNKNGIATRSEGVVLDVVSPPSEIAPKRAVLERTWKFSGFLNKALDTVCEEFTYTWQIIHSRLFIYPKSYDRMFGSITVDPYNIISIRKKQEGDKSTSNNTEKSGIQVRILLDGRIDTSTKLEIVNASSSDSDLDFIKEYVGEYRITGLKHSLSYEGNEWYTDITCEGID